MKRNECVRDMWIGVVTLLFAVVYLWFSESQVSPDGDGYDNITGRTFPYIIGGFLGFLGVGGIIRNLRRLRTAGPSDEGVLGGERAKRVLIYTGAIIAYALGIEYLGYMVSTYIMLAFGMWFSGARLGTAFYVTALVTPPALYFFFTSLMQIPMPRALLL